MTMKILCITCQAATLCVFSLVFLVISGCKQGQCLDSSVSTSSAEQLAPLHVWISSIEIFEASGAPAIRLTFKVNNLSDRSFRVQMAESFGISTMSGANWWNVTQEVPCELRFNDNWNPGTPVDLYSFSDLCGGMGTIEVQSSAGAYLSGAKVGDIISYSSVATVTMIDEDLKRSDRLVVFSGSLRVMEFQPN